MLVLGYLGIIAVLFIGVTHGSPQEIWSPEALVVAFGGAVVATVAGLSLQELRESFQALRVAFTVVTYDYERVKANLCRAKIEKRPRNMWRYRELLPLFDGEDPVTLGEGLTPLVHARRLGSTLGLDNLYVKDESLNPTNSFKARGQSAAITRAKYIGAKTIALPTAKIAVMGAEAAAANTPRRSPKWIRVAAHVTAS